MLIHIFDRSNLDEVVAIKPGGIKVTRREDLETSSFMTRIDIVLINCTRNNKQYILNVAPVGFTGDLWILEMLSDEQHAEVQNIAMRMRANVAGFESARKLLDF